MKRHATPQIASPTQHSLDGYDIETQEVFSGSFGNSEIVLGLG